jgi:ADP-heptose:LPS heptosyltransferase
VCEIVGPADGDIAPVDRASRVVDWPLVDVMALLAGVDCYVGNDSGITHLAAAAGARGVALFGPTSARRWAPLDSGIVGLTGGLRDDAAQAVEALAPARVWEALDRHDCLDKLQSRA